MVILIDSYKDRLHIKCTFVYRHILIETKIFFLIVNGYRTIRMNFISCII